MTFALIYHDIGQSPLPHRLAGAVPDRYTISAPEFQRHLAALAAAPASVGLIRSGAPLPDTPLPDTALTFDDGGASALQAADQLERRGWRGHFFVTTGWLDNPGFLTRAAVVDLVARGHEVGSHSHSHPTYIARMSRSELDREWTLSRDILRDLLGAAPATASVPGGFVSRAVIETAAAAGFGLLLTSEPTSRPSVCGEMTVLGRYAIRSTTTPRQVVGYATGDRSARARLWAAWRAKQLIKRASPGTFEAARRLVQ